MGRVAINGLGRIGRLVLRQLVTVPGLEVVAVNDLADAGTLAHLLTYDSVHGRAEVPVRLEGADLHVNGQQIPAFQEADPACVPFGELGAQLVLECTGRFTRRADAAGHLRDGVRQVLISGPSEDADRTVVLGVNQASLVGSDTAVISAASPVVQALAPLLQVLDGTYGVEAAFVTSVESHTNQQRILDLPHPDLRMARAAALSMIPERTQVAQTLCQVLPHLQGRVEGLTVHVPTPDGSILDLTVQLRVDASLEALHQALIQAATTGPLAPNLEVLEAELVSADLVGRTASCLFDPFLTRQLGPRLFKLFAWYDNELAYATRMKELSLRLLDGMAP